MEEIKLKLELTNRNVHRFRTRSAHDAWVWCQSYLGNEDSTLVLEVANAGDVIKSPFDFSKLFQDHLQGTRRDELIRLRITSRKFRLARDVGIAQDHLALAQAVNQRTSEQVLQSVVANELAFEPKHDDYIPAVYQIPFDPVTKILEVRREDSFRLARDETQG